MVRGEQQVGIRVFVEACLHLWLVNGVSLWGILEARGICLRRICSTDETFLICMTAQMTTNLLKRGHEPQLRYQINSTLKQVSMG